ncbi:MAG: hypothetical protein H7Y36_02290 [Armatimonadetes bacterium]|nr:hypothetical protein [Akkermansiaceae bacterium]
MDITRVSPAVFIDLAAGMLLLFVGYSATAPVYDTGGGLHITFHNELLFFICAAVVFLLFRPSEWTHLVFTVTPLLLIAICVFHWFSFSHFDGDREGYRSDDAIWLFGSSSVAIFAVTVAAKLVRSSRKRRRIQQW